jgi:hypothetical protein
MALYLQVILTQSCFKIRELERARNHHYFGFAG